MYFPGRSPMVQRADQETEEGPRRLSLSYPLAVISALGIFTLGAVSGGLLISSPSYDRGFDDAARRAAQGTLWTYERIDDNNKRTAWQLAQNAASETVESPVEVPNIVDDIRNDNPEINDLNKLQKGDVLRVRINGN